MSRRLPRTSDSTLDDLRRAAASDLDPTTILPAPEPSTAITTAPDGNGSRAPTGAPSPPAAPAAGRPGRGAQKLPRRAAAAVAASPPQLTAPLPAPVRPRKSTVREAVARQVIDRHANMAILAGLVPVPLVDMAAIAAVVDRMLRKLARVYGRRLRRDRSARLATAMLAGVAAPGIARWTATNLLGLIPGTQMIGMAIGSLSATVVVRGIGETFLNHLKSEAAARRLRPSTEPPA